MSCISIKEKKIIQHHLSHSRQQIQNMNVAVSSYDHYVELDHNVDDLSRIFKIEEEELLNIDLLI